MEIFFVIKAFGWSNPKLVLFHLVFEGFDVPTKFFKFNFVKFEQFFVK